MHGIGCHHHPINTHHVRKIWPVHMGALLRGEKNFEVRKEDRAKFEAGEWIYLLEFDPVTEKYSGMVFPFFISAVFRDIVGLLPGYAILNRKMNVSAYPVRYLDLLIYGVSLSEMSRRGQDYFENLREG